MSTDRKGPTSDSDSSTAAAAAAASACFWSPRGRFFCCLASAADLCALGPQKNLAAPSDAGQSPSWQQVSHWWEKATVRHSYS